MKLTKIHRVLKSKQSDWMKKYIDFNTEKRKIEANDSEKDFSKLMINSREKNGKFTKKNQCALVNNAEDFLKYTSRPTYISHKRCGKDYAAIHEIKTVLVLNKLIHVGFTALGLTKLLTYGVNYNFIKNDFDAELLFTDTDSLTHEIKPKKHL